MYSKVLLCLSFFVACSIAALTITELQPSFTQPISVDLSGSYYTEIKLFKVWVPQNVSYFTIGVQNTAVGECSYISIFGRSRQAPCSYDESISDESVCQDLSFSDDFDDDVEYYQIKNYYYTGITSNSGVKYQTETYFYFGFRKYYSSDNSSACSFQILNLTTSYCPSGQVGSIEYSSSDPECESNTPFTLGNTWQIVNETSARTQYSTWLSGFNYGRLTVWINSTTPYLDIYGNSGAAANGAYSGYNYECYESTYTNNGDNYIYEMECYVPAGNRRWYLFIDYDDSPSPFSASVIVTPTICPTGKGGYNCSFNSTKFDPKNPSATMGPYTLPYNVDSLSTPFWYFYIDVNTSISSPQGPFTFTITASSGSGWTYIKFDGYPEDSSTYGFLSSGQYQSFTSPSTRTWYITESDVVSTTRIYIGVENTNGAVDLVFSLNSTLTTTGAPTTGAVTTGSEDSSAFHVSSSLFLILFAYLLSLLF